MKTRPTNPSKLRNSNLELYRILLMLLIIAQHYVVNSNLANTINDNPETSNSIFYMLFGAWGKTGINCFVLITGYFMCTKKITLRKFLKLFLWTLTYCILITTTFILFDYHPLGYTKLLYQVIPLTNLTTGFVSCFLVFYLCIPFLNVLISNISKQQHLWIIILLLFIYTLHGSIHHLNVKMNYISWFCTLYFISSFLKLYPNKKDNDAKFWGYMTAVSWGISILSIIFISRIQIWTNNPYDFKENYFYISDSNSVLALTNGITSFMLFKNIKIKYNKWINTIATSTLGVLIIHANSATMRHWLWIDIIDSAGHYNSRFYWLYAIGCVIGIYIICTIIDQIRMRTIETPLLNYTESLCLKIWHRFNNLTFINNE